MTQNDKKRQDLVLEAKQFARETGPRLKESPDRVESAKKLYGAFAKKNYHALLIPEHCGGTGLDFTSAGIIYETLSYHLPGSLHAPLTTAHCAEMIKSANTDVLKDTYLSEIARGGLAVGFCLTENAAGSDIAAITTKAKKTREGYVINGKKSIVLNHAIASYLIVFATTSPEKGRAGINAFIIKPETQGVKISAPYEVDGLTGGVMGEVLFDKVPAGKQCRLGEEGSGYFLLMETLDKGRPLVAANCTGSANRILDIIVAYTKERQQFHKDLFSFQGVSLPLAEYATRLHASRLLYLDALERIDTGQSFSMEASMAKLFAAETLTDITSFGMDILGYRGIVESSAIKKIFQEAQLMKSIDGTANVQKMVIASQL
ncbi:MAG: acyl-CoA dehydrogenase family protein [Deltaproteobacteria bacterium]|nr:acyl-CoA dehydrogenase family protein [Deltaproteobacteria bacterium]